MFDGYCFRWQRLIALSTRRRKNSTSLNTLRNHLLSQLRKILPTLLVNLHPQVRLREDRNRVSRNPLTSTLRLTTPHKMRHSLQLPPSNKLQRHSSLESQAIPRDVHLRSPTSTIADPETRLRIRVRVEFGERRERTIGGSGRVRDLVDEHLAGEAGEGAEVGVRGAPVVVDFFWHIYGRCGGRSRRREVMQQSRLGAHTCADNLLQRAGLVAVELGYAIPIAGAGYEACYVDDQAAEGFEFRFEAWQGVFAGPDVGGDHFDNVRVQFTGFGFEGGVVDGVGVVRALESVVAAVC